MTKRILVTGASGWIGHRLCAQLQRTGFSVRGSVRAGRTAPPGVSTVVMDALSDANDWSAALADIETVVHVAARVHVMQDKAQSPLSEYRRVNVDGTANLARQAAAAGVKRFIFISSVKVNGEETSFENPFQADAEAAPQDPYGISKMEAEMQLKAISNETGMEFVTIRPPLVYGPGVKANFRALIKLVGLGLPLPLGAIHNKRSMVYIDNLIDLVVTCIDHPQAANQTFLVSDGNDVSTPGLIKTLAHAMHKPVRLVPVPVWLLKVAAFLVGKGGAIERLSSNLQVDISKTTHLLAWTPPISVDDAMRRTVEVG